MSWRSQDRTGSSRTLTLRSEITLSVSSMTWERPWSMAVCHEPSPLKFIVARGVGPRLTTNEGDVHALTGSAFYISQIKRPVRMQFDFDVHRGDRAHEQLALEVHRPRLCELLGTSRLPAAVERVLSSASSYPSDEQPMTPALFRLLDEIAGCDAGPASRQLFLEAKGLELLAALVDAVQEDERAASPHLSQHDIDHLEAARRALLAQLADPPSLPELARCAGLNEAKLKAGFRRLFGCPVYVYLRSFRMEEALRLLRARRHGVTEVALRVGYANPSKFAAAFRKQFGMAPSEAS